ncbi:hypothetical protein H7H52_01465 [Mycolicibacter hiberniae]|uniref:Uncharacterized protein n=1 Tax=Mycolicibacter hiberniae TaxID=29314 RepID=A0A7I7X286_9MYCO|nr:hypothetical protein [Mycolicibacter hiberniae]MCV7084408.1 hypothetical protein [Mycolicibacter hiberniae]ORV67208.1 hypothetical protein AWC09_18665 [Mycolicibacter hiberniae]BBZ22943.1 hypothetical protein MHIB_13610 [Mycolicibacter hiberniae]
MDDTAVVKLRPSIAALLFLLGAAAGLIGDHSHVITGTTEYLPPSQAIPFIWSSPLYFPILVGSATALLAELRLHLPAPRGTVTLRQGVAGLAAVLGSYVVTAMLHSAPVVPLTTLICAFAAITFCALGDRPAIACGVLVAVIGPLAEIGIAAAGQFRYAPGSDQLFGVAPWLVPLYFAFGVVAALIGEFAVGARRQAP